MIPVTKLNDAEVVINCNLIELIESTPDTTITMTTGRKLLVRETVDELVERVVAFNRRSGEAKIQR